MTAPRDVPDRTALDDTPQSALNLRTLLAGFGLLVSLALGVLALRAGSQVAGLALLALAAVALVDLVVLARRRRARAQAHRGADHRHTGLFE